MRKSRWKRFLTAGLSLALSLSLCAPAFAAGNARTAEEVGGDALYDMLEIVNSDVDIKDGEPSTATIMVDMYNEAGVGAEFAAYRLIDLTLNTNGEIVGYKFNLAFQPMWNELLKGNRTTPATIADLAVAIKKNTITLDKILDALYVETLSDPDGVATAKAAVLDGKNGAQATFSGLPMGMYFIKQTEVGGGNNMNGGKQTYIKSAPILVTVPHSVTVGEGESAVTTWYSSVEINAKLNMPSVKKQVNASDDTTDTADWADEATKAIGAEVQYRVVLDVPEYNLNNVAPENIAKVFFMLEDTMKNQNFKGGSMEIYGVPFGTEVSSSTADDTIKGYTKLTDYFTFEAKQNGGDTTFLSKVIDYNTLIDENNYLKPLYSQVVFYYSGILNEHAVVGQPQLNDITYYYQNDIGSNPQNWPDNENPPTPDIPPQMPPVGNPKDETKVYTFGINVDKFQKDDGENEKLLPGAGFTLTRVGETTALYFLEKSNNTYAVDSNFDASKATEIKVYYTDASYSEVAADGVTTNYSITKWQTKDKDGNVIGTYTQTLISGVNGADKDGVTGNLLIEGLDEGDYHLEETIVPEGYTKVKDPIQVKLTALKDNDGFTGKVDDVVEDKEGNKQNDTDGYVNKKIENKIGITLPSTGGTGTIVFTAIGLSILLGCLGFMVAQKAKKKYEA